ncbi:hypothetical protein PVAND_011754 [Polypedilum vanderplanki]|uniref:Uncharacterized protein n=1 Tax=Polypedilum vanderplanki TaxID=319348 RepID=A0A9J6CJL6_POLVA|nr:hypothetical protein PVAND_011754 [Polypedilum vanderplanki]
MYTDLLDNESKNYKSLFEEVAQNDSQLYLDKSFQNAIRYGNDKAQCCCCKVHRKQNRHFIPDGAVTNLNPNTKYQNAPIYNSILMGEMKNATDYIEYLNETRRNSFSSLNKDNRSNYYNSILNGDNQISSINYESMNSEILLIGNESGNNFLQVPKLEITNEHMRRTPEFIDISNKIDQIHSLDSSVSLLIYKCVEVHADILSLDATVSRLLAETRLLLDDLEESKSLDDIIDMLNSESVFHPIIHREWMFPVKNNQVPIDEGVLVISS